MGSSHRNRPSLVVLHVVRNSERDAGVWVAQKWKFQRDVIIEQPLLVLQFDHWGFKNKELLELGLELGFL